MFGVKSSENRVSILDCALKLEFELISVQCRGSHSNPEDITTFNDWTAAMPQQHDSAGPCDAISMAQQWANPHHEPAVLPSNSAETMLNDPPQATTSQARQQSDHLETLTDDQKPAETHDQRSTTLRISPKTMATELPEPYPHTENEPSHSFDQSTTSPPTHATTSHAHPQIITRFQHGVFKLNPK
ncbi:unnamed protein product [Ilex paraguariensis]|uniref:Uncharacterized protein n=1 Tax=Ilex paraguariensis TaxID=185542 RepID=A0ABC8UVR3_9AQUA